MTAIAILGSSGHTARLVIEHVLQRGWEILLATRDGSWADRQGEERSCRRLDFDNPQKLAAAIAGADAVVNCAGPYLDTGLAAARASIAAGIPYLDMTAEQEAASTLFTQLDREARTAQTLVIPAMGFFGSLADLLATSLIETGEEVADIAVAVDLDYWHPTRGTRLTGERNTFPRMVVRQSQRVGLPVYDAMTEWHFPDGCEPVQVRIVPLSEIILLSQHIDAQSVTSYMTEKPLDDLADPDTPPPQASSAPQRFTVDVRVTDLAGRHRRATARGQDIYAVTAPLIVTALERVLSPAFAEVGVRAPGEIFEARPFLNSLAPHLRVEYAL